MTDITKQPAGDLAVPTPGQIDDSAYEENPIAKSSHTDYWSPQNVGERKVGYFLGYKKRPTPDQRTGDIKIIPCVYFAEKTEHGFVVFCNGSAALVGFLQDKIKPHQHQKLTITYTGLRQNSTNPDKSASWLVHEWTLKGSSEPKNEEEGMTEDEVLESTHAE